MSVRLCRQRVTSVSAPLGQFSTSRSSSGEFMPIPRIYRQKRGEMESGVRGWGPRGRAWGCQRPGSWQDAGTLEEELAREGRSQIFSLDENQ